MDNLFNWPPSWSTLLLLPALFVGFTVHELAHALVAFMLGDTSQVERKRLSFNPLRHVSWLGLVAFLLVGIGWAKPVSVDVTRFRIKKPAFGMFLVSISGSTANVLTALLVLFGTSAAVMVVWVVAGTSLAEVLEFLMVAEPGPNAQGLVVALTYYMVLVNLLLAFFNLLPFPPLDGFQAVMSLYNLVRGSSPWQPVPRLAFQPAAGVTDGEVPPSSPAQIHFDIGLDYHKAGEIDEAIARYRQATAQDERFGLAYYNQGLAYWTKGRLPLAASAFRAAMDSSHDPGLRLQADLRLRELARAEQDPEAGPGPVPPPLERGRAVEPVTDVTPPLDPAISRRVWLRLGIGGAGLVVLAAMMWLYVTAVMLAAVL